jgi:glucokinase
MAEGGRAKKARLYLSVDVGGTKIQASLVEETGTILGRQRDSTPRGGGPEQAVVAIERIIERLLKEKGLSPGELTAMGIAIPGVVDPDEGRIVFTANMALTGVEIGAHLESRFHIPVALGNDCNLGALGEAWLGSARGARSAVAILVGTGIGGGMVRKGKLWRGARESALEIGHTIIQIDGPVCGCGNRGCLESLASRTAIERQLRAAVAEGRKTVLAELLQGNLEVIRSRALRQALEAADPLVTEIVHRAAETLGLACINVRHLIDPDVIVLGGGVIEACSEFILPVVENIVGSDGLPGARDGGRVLLSALGDDAVVLGAVALARSLARRSPFKKRFAVTPRYPSMARPRPGEITIGGKVYTRDVFIRVDGEVKKRKKHAAGHDHDAGHTLQAKEVEKACRGGPEVLFVGTGESGSLKLSDEALRFLGHRSIECKALPTPQMAEAYNKSNKRKAAVIHVTC